MESYGWVKLAHVVAVIVWVGGSLVLAVLSAAFLNVRDRTVLKAFFKEAGFFGPMVIGPTSLLTLITGLALAFMSRTFSALWVQIGFGGIVLHFILGTGLIRAASLRAQRLAADPTVDDASLQAAGRRLKHLNLVYQLILFLVVAAMVLKPV